MTGTTISIIVALSTILGFGSIGVIYAKRQRKTVEEFITARDSTGSMTTTATIVASILGAWILFSPSEAATWAGLIAVLGYAVGQALPILSFVVLGPRMRNLMPHGHSLTEFVWFRYGKFAYLLVLSIMVFYLFVFLSAEMGAIARAVELITEVPLFVTLILVGGSTVAYTAYGGLRTSIFTDNIQFILIFPLMFVILVATLIELGGWGSAFDSVKSVNPDLLKLNHQPGIELGLTLMIGILAANLFHQGFWQRVYSAKSVDDVRKGFLTSGLIVIPLIVLAGFFGLWAIGQGVSNAFDPIALFRLALEILPGSVMLALMALALILVMSSMDTLLNGIASIFTTDLSRLGTFQDKNKLLRSSRLITIATILPAMLVGLIFDSVLYLFLIADLVCAAAVTPVFIGLYVRKFTGKMVGTSTILGILSGAVFFPTKTLSGWWTFPELTEFWHILASGNTLASFMIAVIVSSSASVAFAVFARYSGKTQPYDFDELSSRISLLN